MTPDEVGAVIDDPQRRADVPAVELAEAFLARIEELQPVVNAFITITPELALSAAQGVDEARERGESPPLDGLPIVVKDSMDVAGVRTTGASRLFEHRVATEDAPVVSRLRRAGAVVLGKANLHELVFGATTVNPPPFGPCRNPWDIERVSGGSSGGSATALAADLCVGALGSDTGGSIRIPSALCGVSGLRPTFGTVSNRGSLQVSPCLDTIGPMARSVVDLARMLRHMAAYDPADPWAVDYPRAADPPSDLDREIDGLRIGLPRGFFYDELDPEIEALVRGMAETFETLGARVDEISLGADEQLCHEAATIIRSDALAVYRGHVDERSELIGEDILRRFRLGEELGGEAVAAAHQHMREWQRDVREMFRTVDVVLTPATNTVAPAIGRPNTIEMSWKLTYLTYPWSMAGVPVLTIPCGFTAAGLPVGVQLAAAQLGEPVLLRAGAAYQRATDWHRRRPGVLAHT
jgi:aspartyl-tRNA(Asn)/glutamyl-tRNA(Gln) amidotransferase subunit A